MSDQDQEQLPVYQCSCGIRWTGNNKRLPAIVADHTAEAGCAAIVVTENIFSTEA